MRLDRCQSVYVIFHPEGLRKIGHSSAPLNRLKGIQKFCNAKLEGEAWLVCDLPEKDCGPVNTKIARSIEQRAHEILAHKRVVSEWFRVSKGEAVDAVKQAAQEQEVELIDHQFPANAYVSGGSCATDDDLALLRAARILLGVSYRELGENCDVHSVDIQKILSNSVRAENVEKKDVDTLQAIFEEMGAEFLNDGDIGITIKRK